MRLTSVLGYGAAVLLCGCYTYVPTSLDDVRPQQQIRARLTPEEAARLEPVLGGSSRAVEGRVVEESPGHLLLLVSVHSELEGDRVRQFNQRVQVARAEILTVDRRELDRGRTYTAVGAAAVGLALLAANQIFGDGGGTQDQPGPPADEALIPYLSLRLPWGLRLVLGR